jgi:hypothetical protein
MAEEIEMQLAYENCVLVNFWRVCSCMTCSSYILLKELLMHQLKF